MRTISVDTETTGTSPRLGDRAVEIGLVEMINGKRTGANWSTYLSPQGKKVHWGALRVHGLKDSFLADKPLFADKAEEMLRFIDGAPCKAHNARFDRDVLINEFHVTGLTIPKLQFYDTITMARSVLRSQSYKLDTLVDLLQIETPDRSLHGALLDAEILGMVVEKLEEMYPGMLVKQLSQGRALDQLPKFLKGSGAGSPKRSSDKPASRRSVAEPAGKPVREPGALNPGVADMLKDLNATTGEIDNDMSARVRSGGQDVWSRTPVPQALTIASLKWGDDKVTVAISGMEEHQKSAGVRWMCRGMRPDRYAAFEQSRERIALEREQEESLEHDGPGIG